MAQLRQDYQKFIQRGIEILVVAPEKHKAVAHYWENESLPFIGLPDPNHLVANLYEQQVKLLKFGRLPAMALIDRQGYVCYQHYANSMHDIPENKTVLALFDDIEEKVELQ